MNSVDKTQLRRALLDWRDKHLEIVYHHLQRELPLLLNDLDTKIERMAFTDFLKGKSYFKENLEPVYKQWVETEVSLLMKEAQEEQDKIYRHFIEYKNIDNEIEFQDNSTEQIKWGILSSGAAAAGIPVLLPLSTSSLSAGGILGWLGVTTTVINWPVVVIGGAVCVGLGVFGSKEITNRHESYKKEVHQFIKERVLYNEYAIAQCLQEKINEASNNLVLEINK